MSAARPYLLPLTAAGLSCIAALGASPPPGGAPVPPETRITVALDEREPKPDRAPDRMLSPGQRLSMTEVAALPQGGTVFMTTNGDAVNVWWVLTYYWPEVVAAVSLLAGTIWLWRLQRRPRRPGEPYCRRCNYCLTGVSAGVCPECGAALTWRMRVIGRRRRLRLAAALLLAVVLPVAYAASFWFVPRQGAFSQWFNWWSTGLAELATKRKIQWLADRGAKGLQMIVEVDLASGETQRIVCVCSSGEYASQLVVDGDGSDILAVRYRLANKSHAADIVRISARSGRVRQVYPVELPTGVWKVVDPVKAQVLYLESWDTEELWALDIGTGALSFVRRIDMNRRQVGNGAMLDPPIIVAAGPDDRRLVIAEDDGQIHIRRPSVSLGARTYTVELWDGVERSRLAALGASLPIAAMTSSHDGSRLYAAVHGRGLLAWNLDRPELPPWTVAAFEGGLRTAMTVSPDDRWLFLWKQQDVGPGTQPGSIEVFDLARSEWTDRFAAPAGAFVTALSVSGDGRHLAAMCALGGGFQRQVAVYDLDDLDGAAAQPPLARPTDSLRPDARGRTPLHLAAEAGDLAAARALVGIGADVSAHAADGVTPLHLAMANGHWELAEQLLRAGADAGASARDGSTPFERALEGRNDDTGARERIQALRSVAQASALGSATNAALMDRMASAELDQGVADELIRRIRTGRLQPAEYERLLERCASGDQTAVPLSDRWKIKYGRIVEEAVRDSHEWPGEGMPRLAPGRQAL